MSLTKLIDDLAENNANLRSAMQGADVAAIEDATRAFYATLEQVKAVGQWPATPDLRDKLAGLVPQLEEARALANLLTDMTGQMHELAVSRAPDARQPVYSRTGARYA